VKLVDLGTATASHLTQITTENEVVGTLAYIAPERLAAESVGEPPADVYSLAVVAFEALTGRRPYEAETPRDILDEIAAGPQPDLRDHWPEAPVRLARVVMQGMHRDPVRRQASASLLVREIEAALPPAGAEAPPPIERTQPYTPPEEPADSPPLSVLHSGYAPRRRPRWIAPALLGICALLALGAWLAFSGGGGGNGGGQTGKQASASGKSGSGAGGGAPASSAAAATPATPAAPDTPVGAPPVTSAATAGSDGAQLNDEGYSLIQQGRYDEAIPILRRAVASFPPGTTDINYAYALFNLGHALRLAGQPDEAIPILERRLQIPDQTETVQRELDAARAAAGQQ
jgi:serine/threonine-protein kinase